jgi:hypothetical protein
MRLGMIIKNENKIKIFYQKDFHNSSTLCKIKTTAKQHIDPKGGHEVCVMAFS